MKLSSFGPKVNDSSSVFSYFVNLNVSLGHNVKQKLFHLNDGGTDQKLVLFLTLFCFVARHTSKIHGIHLTLLLSLEVLLMLLDGLEMLGFLSYSEQRDLSNSSGEASASEFSCSHLSNLSRYSTY